MKTLLTIFISCLCITSSAQIYNYAYILFNDADGAAIGIEHLPARVNYATNKYRCEKHFFHLADTNVKFYRIFMYINPINLPDNPILTKPLSFLNEIEYIEREEHTKNFTRQQYLDFLEQLETYDKVYFIDRSEIKDGIMKMYPVKEFKPGY